MEMDTMEMDTMEMDMENSTNSTSSTVTGDPCRGIVILRIFPGSRDGGIPLILGICAVIFLVSSTLAVF